jgi:diguanylate cyclase (GGDEF)-like protein/PAS domain S-box-containing protein/putative nucleotidyltransferase with HDIG domain
MIQNNNNKYKSNDCCFNKGDNLEQLKVLDYGLKNNKSFFNQLPIKTNIIDKEYNILSNDSNDKYKGLDNKYSKCFSLLKGRKDPCPDCRLHEVIKNGNIVEKFINNKSIDDIKSDNLSKVIIVPLKNNSGDIYATYNHQINVSELFKVEKELRDSKELYLEMLENTPVGIVNCDLNGNINYFNKKICEIIGYSTERTSQVNLFSNEYLVDDGITEKMLMCVRNKKNIDTEYYKRLKNGKELWLKLLIRPELKDGNVKGIRIVIDDILEMKKAERILLENKKNFSAFFDGSDDIFMVINKTGDIIYANKTAEDRLEYKFDDEVYNIKDIIYDSTEAHIIYNKIVKGEVKKILLPIVGKNNKKISSEIRVSEGIWNNQKKLFIIAKDMSEEQENLEKFNMIFANNPTLMVITTYPEKKLVDVNSVFLEKTGYKKEEVIGRTEKYLNLFLDENDLFEAKEELLKTGSVKNIHLNLRTKCGKILDGLFSGVIINTQGKQYLHAVMMDITEIKKYQKQIEYISYHDSLTGLYNRRFFEEQLTRLEETNKDLSMIVADVNGLKPINDKFGHLAGDNLLKSVATIMLEVVGEQGFVSRIGGDEFAIILEDSQMLNQEIIVNKIKLIFSKMKIEGICVSVAIGYQSRCAGGIGVYQLFKEADEYMYKNKLADSMSLRNQTVQVIMQTLFEKSERERAHSQRVCMLATKIAEALGFNNKRLDDVKLASLMHDIGKISIDNSVLDKPDKLNYDEYDVIKTHPAVGYKILKTIKEYEDIAEFVVQHHEKYDGTGYPYGLSYNQLHDESKIIAIADAYDAMTCERPYRSALNKQEAIEEIRKFSSTQFDPEIVEVAINEVFLPL